jgi:hypothetical protein
MLNLDKPILSFLPFMKKDPKIELIPISLYEYTGEDIRAAPTNITLLPAEALADPREHFGGHGRQRSLHIQH